MIEKLFKASFPVELTECLLFINDNPVPLKKTYIFIKTTYHKIAKVGNDWVEGHVRGKTHVKGYFYSDELSFGLFNEELDGNDVKLIGNSGNSQYKLFGISLGKSKNHIGEQNYHISKFSALDYEVINLAKNKTERQDVGDIEEGGDIL